MNTKSHQAERTQQTEQTSVEPEATRNRATRQHIGRTAMAIVTIAIGGGLTALVIGVTGDAGTGTEAPPDPGFQLPYQNELPPQGLDQRLYNLAEERAAERQAEMKVAPGADQRLYNLAEERAAERQAKMKLAPGADLRLYNLAEERASQRYAR